MQHDNGNHPTLTTQAGPMRPDVSTPTGADRYLAQSLDDAGAAGPSSGAAPLTGGWLIGAWALVAGALALAAGGFVNSFSAVRLALEPSFGELAWTVPVLIDVGIAVFSGIDLLFTRLDMRLRWLRLVPWTLNGATIWLNVADEKTSVGVVAHAAAPILWIVTVELAGHFLRARNGLEASPGRRRASGRMDRARLSRWLMAPWSTLVIRRSMIMQEERSFDRAYARWWARKEARWELQNTYGLVAWRWKAPRELRGRYRYGNLTPTSPETATGPASTPEPEATPAPPAPAEPRRPTRRAPSNGSAPGGRHRAGPDDVRAAVTGLRDAGQAVNRTVVTQHLRAKGLSLSNERADRLLADIDETPDPQDAR
jgi:hypothetical protein